MRCICVCACIADHLCVCSCMLLIVCVCVCVCVLLCLQGYEVRKIRAIDQDLGRPRGIGYTIISGPWHIINLTSAAPTGSQSLLIIIPQP